MLNRVCFKNFFFGDQHTVTAPAGINTRYIQSYHRNNSLLFQFILIEFIEAFEKIQKLDALSGRKPSPVSEDNKKTYLSQPQRAEIALLLADLVGSAPDYMRMFSWNFNEGLLAKLKAYCTLLLQNSEGSEKELIAMQHYTDKIWQGCWQAHEHLNEEPGDPGLLLTALEKSSNATHRFAKIIARTVTQFRDDENVLLCILRHRGKLDRLYGNRFTVKLLYRLYPKGLKEALHFLSRRYAARGFDNILSILPNKIAEVENSSL